jgi:hypothetical protein
VRITARHETTVLALLGIFPDKELAGRSSSAGLLVNGESLDRRMSGLGNVRYRATAFHAVSAHLFRSVKRFVGPSEDLVDGLAGPVLSDSDRYS